MKIDTKKLEKLEVLGKDGKKFTVYGSFKFSIQNKEKTLKIAYEEY